MSEHLLESLQPSSRGSTVDNVLHGLFQNGDSAQKYLQGSRSMKIDNWILLDNYVQGRNVSPGSHIKALQIHSKRSRKHMSMKQLKRSGALDLPKDLQKWVTGDAYGCVYGGSCNVFVSLHLHLYFVPPLLFDIEWYLLGLQCLLFPFVFDQISVDIVFFSAMKI